MATEYELDEKDLKLIEMLASNARLTYTDMAKTLGISDVAVLKRVKKLESKVLKKYTIVVDPRKVGYKTISLTGIDVEPEKLFDVITKLKDNPSVKGLYLTTGDHPIISIIWAKDDDDLVRIHREISEINGVKRVCPAIVLRTLKEIELWFNVD
ncbi:MAG: Lrp/AsnC family transcriptional regulator [Ignisphaera sp.]|nr:Lrp/AsnC family transcriptional regulator [Ignisphaera sp.]MCX8168431.1 Lrp/AsnC family transcriptional regulator [Ignisphaera sp.]MDW8086056.1 Lrp/AsnC family transcriptional regulator [Ignisphaera sp.]